MKVIECIFLNIGNQLELVKVKGNITAIQLHKLHKQIKLLSDQIGKYNGSSFKKVKNYREKLADLKIEFEQITKRFFSNIQG